MTRDVLRIRRTTSGGWNMRPQMNTCIRSSLDWGWKSGGAGTDWLIGAGRDQHAEAVLLGSTLARIWGRLKVHRTRLDMDSNNSGRYGFRRNQFIRRAGGARPRIIKKYLNNVRTHD